MSYQAEYLKSIQQPEQFWQEKSQGLPWFLAPKTIFSTDKQGKDHWFKDAQMNTCYMALDHHIKIGHGEDIALIYDSPVTHSKKTYTFNALLAEVSKCAGMLKEHGVEQGDRVIIYMPMIPQTVIGMLACARLGAIHSVVFGGFAPTELATRIDDATPKVMLLASCGIEVKKAIAYKKLADDAMALAQYKIKKCIVYQREQELATMVAGRDIDWQQAQDKAKATDCVALAGDTPLYILYTSGTTGKPKGIVRENAGHAVALKYSMDAVYNAKPGDVYWAASDVGWVVGHSYIVYAPLLQGCTTVLFEGKPVMTPDAGAFWRVVEEYRVNILFAAPTAFRAVKKEDPEAKLIKQYDTSSLQAVFVAGEQLDPATYQWLNKYLEKPVIDHWWQTETGWAISANLTGIESMPVKLGSSTMPVPGFQIDVLDDEGQKLARGIEGNIVIKLPLPPSCLNTIWNDHQKYVASYLTRFPGYYSSSDGGYIDKDGYIFIMGRTDDVINIAGHRLSTGTIESIIGLHESVAECAVVAMEDKIKGHIPVGFVVLKSNTAVDTQTIQENLFQLVREKLGAIACYKDSIIVQRLPKTRSGKVLRKTIRSIINAKDFVTPATIDDPKVLEEIQEVYEINLIK